MIVIKDIVESKQLDSAHLKEVKGGAFKSFSYHRPVYDDNMWSYDFFSLYNTLK